MQEMMQLWLLSLGLIEMRKEIFANFNDFLAKFVNFYEIENGRPRILNLCS